MASPETLEFEDYNTTSKVYDQSRKAVGAEEVLLKLVNKDSVVGDFGCGTGNYLCRLAPHVHQIIGLEQNQGMIDQTVTKITRRGIKNASLVTGSLLEDLPFEPNKFDLIMVNQVVHHLDTGEDPTYPNTRQMISNLPKVLKPGGFFSLSLSTQEQKDSYWWQYLIRDEKEIYAQRHIPTELLLRYLQEAGFVIHIVTPIWEPLQGDFYSLLMGPTMEWWRQGDSIWSQVPDDKLAQVVAYVSDLNQKGELGQYFDQHDAVRRRIGQSTFFVARRK